MLQHPSSALIHCKVRLGLSFKPWVLMQAVGADAGADAVLGMIPLARELLRGTCEVIMVANARPAINDVTVWELQALLHSASAHCSLLKACPCPGVMQGLALYVRPCKTRSFHIELDQVLTSVRKAVPAHAP